jgi:uncharacterized protein (DUF885 family)
MNEADTQFYKDFDDYLEWSISRSPVTATVMGIHEYDDRLGDLSLASQDEEYRFNQQYAEKFARAEGSEDKNVAVDASMVSAMVRASIQSYEQIQARFRMADMYIDEAVFGPYVLLSKDFAPLPERLSNLAKRLADVPGVLEQGMKNLERPPKIWTQIAMQHAAGGVSFYENAVPAVAAGVPELASQVQDASRKAADAMKDFLRYLEEDLLPRSDGEYAIGEQLWNEIVQKHHMLDADADEIEETGRRLITETNEEMTMLADKHWPGKTVPEVLAELRSNHPQPGELLDVYRKFMRDSRQFIIDHDLVTIPKGENLEIQETPEFQRPTLPFAAYLMPGPFEKEQQGVFWVTPVDPNLPDEERETRLRGHPYGKIAVTAVHEGYPGHHLQLVRGNAASTMPRKIAASTLFVEGWAFYCEEMMEQQGFLTDPASKFLRLSDQLWRACRIVIDVGLHTRGMSVDEGIDMLVNVAGLERPDATAEVHRYTMSPTQPMCYLIGKLELMKIADEYKRRKGSDFKLKTFHDELLSLGSLTPKLIRKMLF